MLKPQKTYITPEEYLVLEEVAEYRSEYYQGEIFAMTGGTVNHNRIARDICQALTEDFEGKPCEAFMNDVRLLVQDNGLYTYPDLMVVCGDIVFAEGRDDTVTNPIVLVEVLSKSTGNYDRGPKFELYRALDTLQDYVLVDQAKVHVEHFKRLPDNRWILQEFNHLTDTLHIETIQFEMSLQKIYRNVTWDEV